MEATCIKLQIGKLRSKASCHLRVINSNHIEMTLVLRRSINNPEMIGIIFVLSPLYPLYPFVLTSGILCLIDKWDSSKPQ